MVLFQEIRIPTSVQRRIKMELETEIVEGQALRVINIHQSTSNDRKRQDVILDGLIETLLSRESIPTMLGGDLNDTPPGGRFGYATGNGKHINNVDKHINNCRIS